MTAEIDRRKFLERTAAAGAAISLASVETGNTLRAAETPAAPNARKKIRVGVIGCGSVSHRYLPHLAACPFAELVSTCDIMPERGRTPSQSIRHPNHYPAHRQDARRRAVRPVGQSHRHAGARASQSRGDRRRQTHLERKADRQYAGRRAGDLAAGQSERRADLGRAGRRHQPAIRLHGENAGRRQSSAASPLPTPTMGTRAPIGRRSSTKRAAAACPTWASTTSRASPACSGPRGRSSPWSASSRPRARSTTRARSKSPKKTTRWSCSTTATACCRTFNADSIISIRTATRDAKRLGTRFRSSAPRAAWASWATTGSRSASIWPPKKNPVPARTSPTRRLRLAARRIAGLRMPGHRQGAALHARACAARRGDHRRRARIPADGPADRSEVDIQMAGSKLRTCFRIVSIVASGYHWLCQCTCRSHGMLRVRTGLVAACTPPCPVGILTSLLDHKD